MKKNKIYPLGYFMFAVLLSVINISCSKKNEKINLNEEKTVIDSELLKLNSVFMNMTEECKDAIPNGNAEEFLHDLYMVLEAEKKYSSDEADLYTLVDKKHNIGPELAPVHLVMLEKNDAYVINKSTLSLRAEAESALREMGQAAKKDGITLTISSSYRSYEYQNRTFNYWADIDGEEIAETYSARPGTSQHQLGTAVDFGSIDDSFADTKQSDWLSNHAAEYGWSLSFPLGYEDVTGYKWESWHYRFIGKEACNFQKKWFGNIQQFMLEFINEWKIQNFSI